VRASQVKRRGVDANVAVEHDLLPLAVEAHLRRMDLGLCGVRRAFGPPGRERGLESPSANEDPS
jgi:hypothetical protein